MFLRYDVDLAPSSSGPGRRPLTAVARVRIPSGLHRRRAPHPPGCGALVIDRERLQKQAATSLRRTRGGFVIDAVRPNGVDRPWSPAVGDTAEPENSYPRPVIARPVDATPAEADLQAEE